MEVQMKSLTQSMIGSKNRLHWKCEGGNGKIVISAVILLLITLVGVGSTTATTFTEFPLQPPDTSSPRATMESFTLNMQEAHKYYQQYTKTYMEEPGWFASDAALAEFHRATIFF